MYCPDFPDFPVPTSHSAYPDRRLASVADWRLPLFVLVSERVLVITNSSPLPASRARRLGCIDRRGRRSGNIAFRAPVQSQRLAQLSIDPRQYVRVVL